MAAPTPTPAPAKQPPRRTEDAAAGHKPYVPDEAKMPEFTWSAVIVGTILGIVFGASSLYLVLKVGLTVSASIPVAVLSITLFRGLSKVFGLRPATILENNIVQTTGSAGESIAFGVGVTMPALMLLGFEMDIGRVMVVSVLGGMLGIMMMIPLRRAFIVRQHGRLKYPEGTACADVLIVGEQGGSSATTVFVGFGVAAVYQFLWRGLILWKEIPSRSLSWFKGAMPAIEVNPALLGVGYIIGTKISCVMVAGGVLSAFVMIPAICLFGDGLLEPLYPGKVTIAQMNEEDIWRNYVLYIGAGAVAAGGIISLFQAMPLILGSIRSAFADLGSRGEKAQSRSSVRRTDRDLPVWIVGIGSLILIGAIWATTPLHRAFPWFPDLGMNIWGAGLIVVFGFLFVTVSSRLTGEIGSSSNPISGMTVATLLLTCTIFLLLGKTGVQDQLTALSVAAVVCIAASNGGTTSQDLKTGFLVGATPKWQQWSIMAGSVSSALVIGVILVVLNRAATVYSNKDLPQPRVPIDVSQLTEIDRAPDDNTPYHLWRAVEGNPQGVPPADYLVNDQGQIRYLVDPGINGGLDRRPDGTPVVKYHAPKAQLMAFVTKGILNRNLPWELVLLGVAIAIVLELCRVPSLPFAVGVYLPLSSSAPIFVGGLVRWIVDGWSRRGKGKQEISDTDSDMSPGVLMATGYIAGGAIVGVLIAFLSFGETIPKLLATWQFRTAAVTQAAPLDQQYLDVAWKESEPGNSNPTESQLQSLKSLEGIMFNELQRIKTNMSKPDVVAYQLDRLAHDENRLTHLAGVNSDDKETKSQLLQTAETIALAHEIAALNRDRLPSHVTVRKGASLNIPGNKRHEVKQDSNLGQLADEILSNSDKAALLLDLNSDQLRLPTSLPVGTNVKLPQKNWPAVAAFSLLAILLVAVGIGAAGRASPTAAKRDKSSDS